MKKSRRSYTNNTRQHARALRNGAMVPEDDRKHESGKVCVSRYNTSIPLNKISSNIGHHKLTLATCIILGRMLLVTARLAITRAPGCSFFTKCNSEKVSDIALFCNANYLFLVSNASYYINTDVPGFK